MAFMAGVPEPCRDYWAASALPSDSDGNGSPNRFDARPYNNRCLCLYLNALENSPCPGDGVYLRSGLGSLMRFLRTASGLRWSARFFTLRTNRIVCRVPYKPVRAAAAASPRFFGIGVLVFCLCRRRPFLCRASFSWSKRCARFSAVDARSIHAGRLATPPASTPDVPGSRGS
jgi:hypothetical protein